VKKVEIVISETGCRRIVAVMAGSSRRLSIGLVFGLLVASCAPAPSPKWPHGDDGFSVSAIAYWDAPELLKRARVLFRQGNQRRQGGDYEGALDYYERSRNLVASASNTLNVAVCLDKLGRSSEAIDTYGALLNQFGDELDEREREFVAKQLQNNVRIFGNRKSSEESPPARRVRVFD